MEYFPYLPIYYVKNSAKCSLTTEVALCYNFFPRKKIIPSGFFTFWNLPDLGKMRKTSPLKSEGVFNSTV